MQDQESGIMAPMVMARAETADRGGRTQVRSSKSAQGIGGGARIYS